MNSISEEAEAGRLKLNASLGYLEVLVKPNLYTLNLFQKTSVYSVITIK